MIRILLISLLLSFSLAEFAQVNLVPNGSFEDTVACPWTDGQINYAVGWFKPTPASSDLIHSCNFAVPQNFFGYQNAKTGNAYAGFYTYHPLWSPDSSYREYICVKLTDSLVAGKKYDVEFYVSRSDSSHYATILGAYLSSDSLTSNSATNLPYIPQLEEASVIIEKSLWVKLSYKYTATGGEKYLTIGNFRDDFLSDTVNTNDGGLSGPDYSAAYYFIDDIAITEDTTVGISDLMISRIFIFPNPTNGVINIESKTAFKECVLINIITQQQGVVKVNSSNEIDISDNPPGMYLLSLVFNSQTITQKIVLTR